MSGLVVDLLLHGEVLRTVPFDRPALRIGRMRENDIVVDGPAASRFHARLQLEAGRVFLEDGGSENGSLVNDRRVRGRRELAPGDRILIGSHELRVRSRRLDEQSLVDAQTAPPATPCEDMVEAQMDDAVPERDEPRDAEPAAVVEEHGSGEFDFEPTEFADPEDDDEALAAPLVDDDATEAQPDPEPLHATPVVARFAGLIVQRDGKIDRVVPWEGDAFTVGRSSESDLVLPQDEVSRKHARFVRSEDRYEVHDLGSVNGTLVNGARVDVHALAVGDVITIEGFELTFVLDREPIAGAMKPSATPLPQTAPPVAPADSDWQVDALEALDEAPELAAAGSSGPHTLAMPGAGDATIANVMLEEDSIGAADGAGPLTTLEVERAHEGADTPDVVDGLDMADGLDDLPFEATIDQRKELAAVQPRGSSRAASVQDLGAVAAPARTVTLELRLRLDQLPEPLRHALEQAGVSDLVIPADLRLRTD